MTDEGPSTSPARPVLVEVLGPLRVLVEGEPVSVAPREAGLLAALADAGADGATLDAVAETVWGRQAPRSVRQSVHNHVTRLRTKLHPGWVELVGGRYRMASAVVSVDAELLTLAVRDAEELLLDGEPQRALELVDSALGRWRGQPFQGFDDLPDVAEVRTRLEQVRAALRDLRVDALVATGRTTTAVVELYQTVAQDPAREGAWIRLIGLLQQAGRRGDAVAAFHAARDAVREQLGLEPSEALRAAVSAVLSDGHEGDPEVGPPDVRPDGPLRRALADSPVVGRVLDLVADGRRMVLLVGDAGADVSAMARVVAERAAEDRLTVLAARCTAHPGSALQPLRDIVVALGDLGLVDLVRGVLLPDGTDLPGLAQLAGRRPARTTAIEVGRLVDHVTTDLLRVARQVGGLVLLIDEAQQAGPTTRAVLSRVGEADGPVVVVGAWTGDDPVQEAVPAGIEVVRVPALTPQATRTLILGLIDCRSVGDDLVARVHALTGGSPFFVAEVVADLRRRGALRREPDGTVVVVGELEHQLRQVPTTVAQLVRRGLAGLDERVRHVLEVVAALGEQTQWVLLNDLVGQEAAERAVATGVLDLDLDLDDGGRVWFRRPLVGSVVRESMPRGRVLEFNDAAALAATRRDCAPSVIAWHRVAATELTTGGVVQAAWAAGDAAMDEQAFAEAAAWYRRALEALHHDADQVVTAVGPRSPELVSIELQILRANALRLGGDPAHTALLLDAAQAALASGDALLQRLAAQMVSPLGGTSEAGRLPRRALEIVEQVLARESDPASRAKIASSASLLMSMAGEAERCRSLFLEADRISAGLGHARVRAAVLPYAYLGLGHPTDLAARESAGRELLELSVLLGDDVAAYEAHHLLFSTGIQRADGAGVRAAHAAMTDLLATVSDVGRRWSWHYQEAAVAHLEGRLADAVRSSEKALEVGQGLAVSRAEAAHAGQMLDVARAAGGLADLLGPLAELVVDQPTVHAWHAAYALAISETAELVTPPDGLSVPEAVARHVALVLEPVGGVLRHRDFLEVPALFMAGRAAARTGLVDECRRLHEALLPYSGLIVWQGTCAYGPVDLVLGYLSAALGEPAQAVASTRAAAAQSRSLGAPLFAAECEALLAVLPAKP